MIGPCVAFAEQQKWFLLFLSSHNFARIFCLLFTELVPATRSNYMIIWSSYYNIEGPWRINQKNCYKELSMFISLLHADEKNEKCLLHNSDWGKIPLKNHSIFWPIWFESHSNDANRCQYVFLCLQNICSTQKKSNAFILWIWSTVWWEKYEKFVHIEMWNILFRMLVLNWTPLKKQSQTEPNKLDLISQFRNFTK